MLVKSSRLIIYPSSLPKTAVTYKLHVSILVSTRSNLREYRITIFNLKEDGTSIDHSGDTDCFNTADWQDS